MDFDPRTFKSLCCNARVQEVLKRISTKGGIQIVYQCNACEKMHVIKVSE